MLRYIRVLHSYRLHAACVDQQIARLQVWCLRYAYLHRWFAYRCLQGFWSASEVKSVKIHAALYKIYNTGVYSGFPGCWQCVESRYSIVLLTGFQSYTMVSSESKCTVTFTLDLCSNFKCWMLRHGWQRQLHPTKVFCRQRICCYLRIVITCIGQHCQLQYCMWICLQGCSNSSRD